MHAALAIDGAVLHHRDVSPGFRAMCSWPLGCSWGSFCITGVYHQASGWCALGGRQASQGDVLLGAVRYQISQGCIARLQSDVLLLGGRQASQGCGVRHHRDVSPGLSTMCSCLGVVRS
jgi:hypothetical protein